ncbi:hypothetical protein [Aestuariivirga sp.]|uniref:hypothetical protein n=1 Tax=Aestuariivirga sp. TaxID=2650926 RepID=UPI0035B257FE
MTAQSFIVGFLALLLAVVLFGWIKELLFYRARAWDFTVDSGITRAHFTFIKRWQFGPAIRIIVIFPLWMIALTYFLVKVSGVAFGSL